MTGSIPQRIYWRILRLFGFNRLSWNSQFDAGVWGKRPSSPNTIKRVIELCEGGKVIEFGCGEGNLPHLLPPGCFSDYVGYDISDLAIHRAQRRASNAGILNCHFEQCDMASWPGSFNVSLIVVEECLYYLSSRDTEKFLSRCKASLAREGSILVIVHSGEKHAGTLHLCRNMCKVREETVIASRTYLTLAPELP